MIIITLISIVVLILILIFIYFFIKYETFNNYNNIYFFTKNEANKFIIGDKDNYIKNLTELDLYARKVRNSREYIDNILKTTVDFTEDEKKKLTKCAIASDNFLKNCSLYKNTINYNDIINIKWIFACTDNYENFQYEEGLPHTRENIIFLTKNIITNNEDNLINTLIHEKIHIYQRYNKNIFDKLNNINGFVKINYNNKYIRSNPDTTNDIYLDTNTNNVMVCLYRNTTPFGINDVIMKNYSLEHPYEKYAYEIANYYYSNNKYISL